MRAVVQRVSEARVLVGGEVAGEIEAGLCVLLGVAFDDNGETTDRLAGKVARLRILLSFFDHISPVGEMGARRPFLLGKELWRASTRGSGSSIARSRKR